MINIKGCTLCVFFIVFFTACSSGNIKNDYSLSEDNETGLLIASLVRSGDSNFSLFADIRGVDNKYNNSIPITDLFASSDWECPTFGSIPKDAPCGRLVVIKMQKGKYEFYGWHGSQGNNFTIRSTKEFSKKFTINPGKATYIGSIHFIITRKETGESILGIAISKPTFDIEISNMQDRDLSLFHKTYPKIPDEKVQVKIAQ